MNETTETQTFGELAATFGKDLARNAAIGLATTVVIYGAAYGASVLSVKIKSKLIERRAEKNRVMSEQEDE